MRTDLGRVLVWACFSLTTAVALVLAVSVPFVSAADEKLSIQSVTLQGQSQTIPITLSGFTNLGATTITLGWNPSLVRVAISDGTLPGGAMLGDPEVYNPVAISYFSATGFSGQATLANVTVTPLRTGDGTLDLEVTICVDTGANPIVPAVNDGMLVVLGPATTPPGDGSAVDRPNGGTQGESTDESEDGREGAAPLTPAPPSAPEIETGDPVWSVSPLAVSPIQVLASQEVTISADICNAGDEDGSRTVSLEVNGTAEQWQSVTVPGGECRQVTFKTSHTTPGTYHVVVGGVAGQFVVLGSSTDPSTVPVPPPAGLGTGAIVAIVVGSVSLIGALVLLFRRRQVS